MSQPLQLIVGLGNPGAQYDRTRHNAGFWFLDALCQHYQGSFREQKKYQGLLAEVSISGQKVLLLKPMTLMNLSGKSVAPLANFFKIPPASVLVAHDELSIPVGAVKLKQGGSHSGHNGLKSIDGLYGRDYHRLRIGIDHPGDKSLVTPYVLGAPSPNDRRDIDTAIHETLRIAPTLVNGEWEAAKQVLHNIKPNSQNK